MPAKRARSAVDDDHKHAGKQTRPTKTQKKIKAFGNVAKRQAEDSNLNKRKRGAEVEDSDDEIALPALSVASEKENEVKAKVTSTPRNKRLKNALPPTPAETPSKGAAALFNRLNIDSKSRAIPFALQSRPRAPDTPPHTPTDENDTIDLSFPPELAELQTLHASFLKSLSLYYAHNGASSPVDMRTLLPLITKHWKKRKTTLEDLQRVLGLAQNDAQFILQDYGKAGVCLTKAQSRGRALKRAASYLDEEAQNAKFEDNLQNAWNNWQTNTPKEKRTATAFIDQLPFAEITQHASVAKTAPIFARGQQRLADIKNIAATKTPTPIPETQTTQQQQSLPKSLQNRSTALLDRILAKQSLASTLPAGPTKHQLERKSALHRIEDVARILSLLIGSKERCSFSLPTLTQQIQQSLRNPISREEVQRCFELMAGEITPGFVKVLQMGEVKGVVISRSLGVGLAELRERIEKAVA